MPRKLAIVGAGGHGRVVADCAMAFGWQEMCFFDDGLPQGVAVGHWTVEGSIAQLKTRLAEFEGVVVAIGNNGARWTLHRQLVTAGAPLANIIHPRALVSAGARLGSGCVLVAGAIVNTGALLGDAVVVNTAATVDHDCTLGDAVHVSPGAHLAGAVAVGERSWIGIGAVVRERITIGVAATVGAGAVVVVAVGDGVTVVGNPARALPRPS